MANSVKWSHRPIQRGPSLYSIEAGILPTQVPQELFAKPWVLPDLVNRCEVPGIELIVKSRQDA